MCATSDSPLSYLRFNFKGENLQSLPGLCEGGQAGLCLPRWVESTSASNHTQLENRRI